MTAGEVAEGLAGPFSCLNQARYVIVSGVHSDYAVRGRATGSMRVAMADLGLSRLYVVHPGTARYGLGDRAEAIGLPALLGELGAQDGKAPRRSARAGRG